MHSGALRQEEGTGPSSSLCHVWAPGSMCGSVTRAKPHERPYACARPCMIIHMHDSSTALYKLPHSHMCAHIQAYTCLCMGAGWLEGPCNGTHVTHMKMKVHVYTCRYKYWHMCGDACMLVCIHADTHENTYIYFLSTCVCMDAHA